MKASMPVHTTPAPSTGMQELAAGISKPHATPPPLAELVDVAAERSRHGTKAAIATKASEVMNGDSPSAMSSAEPPPMSATERCRRARALASQWMSSLMEQPPTTAEMSTFRARHAAQLADREGCVPAGSHGAATAAATASVKSTHAAAPVPPSAPSSSFAEIVRRGGGQTKPETPPLTPAPIPPPATAGIAATRPFTASVQTSSAPNLHTGPATSKAKNGTEEAAGTSPFLMPLDTDAMAPLLISLREVALSSSSLETMRLLSSLPGGREVMNGASTNRGKRHHGHGSSSHSTPPLSPSVGPAAALTTTAMPNTVPATFSVDPAVESVFAEQWRTVQAEFLKVEQLVQNKEDFSRVLATQLGADWRTATTTTTTTTTRISTITAGPAPGATDTAPPLSGGANSKAHASSLASVGAPPAPVATATGGAAGSGLNLNARPFQSRTYVMSVSGRVVAGTTVLPIATDTASSSGVEDAVGLTRTEEPALAEAPLTSTRKDVKSLQKLSESATAYYSPSPHVASFIERNSPVPTLSGTASSTSTLSAHASPYGSMPTTPVVGSRADLGVNDVVDTVDPLLPSGVPSTPTSSTSSTASRSVTGGLHMPITPNAIGTVESTRFPSYPPRPGRGSLPGGDGSTHMGFAGANTLSGHGMGAQPYHFSSPTPYSVSGAVASPTGAMSQSHNSAHSASSIVFHLESREDMLRRRQAAPSVFYGAASHPTVTNSPASYSGGGGGGNSTAGAGGVYSPGSLRPHHAGNTPMSMPVSPLISMGNTPVMAPQCPYDYILVLDFEATCEEHPPPGYLYEIIEFPVVLVDVRLQRAMTEFHRFVKPTYKPVLSAFCRQLTGILQHEIDTAQPLEEVLRQFERWLHQTVPPTARVMFATDGPMDFREFMLHHSVQRQGIRFPTIFYQFIDVKQAFATFLHCQPGKIKAMLEVLNIPFEGRLHSGLDDARNIARIVIGLLQWGSTLCEAPLNRIPLNGGPSAASPNASTPSGALYLPPSTAEAASASSHAQHSITHSSNNSWLASARETPYSVDGTFYA